jgi:hypothetical protein
VPATCKDIETESRLAVARVRAEGRIGTDGNVLKLNSGDVCTTRNILKKK